jgi:hypothetical protein
MWYSRAGITCPSSLHANLAKLLADSTIPASTACAGDLIIAGQAQQELVDTSEVVAAVPQRRQHWARDHRRPSPQSAVRFADA